MRDFPSDSNIDLDVAGRSEPHVLGTEAHAGYFGHTLVISATFEALRDQFARRYPSRIGQGWALTLGIIRLAISDRQVLASKSIDDMYFREGVAMLR